ncbi:MAG: hypothetical protein HOQ27_14215 [Dermatophilaceae bacterium]|nr:hypothetical protein [Dermatophilaceae bacterium]
MSKSEPKIPDLASLLAEASRPSAKVTVPLKQGLRERIEKAEADLEQIATDAHPSRMGAKSPLKAKAEEIEALRAEMAASALTFHFEALTAQERVDIRHAMQGRDNPDEMNLRAIATMCRRVETADGAEFPDRMKWEDFDALRDRIGAQTFDLTIDAAAERAGGGDWSVPFSPTASHILGTAR